MAAHKHAKLIKAKADNMELVVFVKNDEWDLTESCNDALMFFAGKDYFLCLPQHKEACLHWLNSGDVEFRRDGEEWQDEYEEYHGWADYCGMMNNDVEFRTKPRKEKRWIGYHKYGHTTTEAYATKDDAKSDTVGHDNWQFIEIEVEI